MTAVLLLLIVVGASLVAVRAGGVALELTGMESEKARFQALSAFTNTGFTTREAEEITRYPARRKIISTLIVLGRAGTVSVIATFATSLLERDLSRIALHLGIIAVAVFIIYRMAVWQRLKQRMGDVLRRWLLNHYDLRAPSLEEMLVVAEGIGVVRVTVQEGASVVSRSLAELDLKARKVQLLSIIRGEQIIAVPKGDDTLHAGDVAICYGDTRAATELLTGAPA